MSETTKEERKAARAKAAKGMDTRDPEKYMTGVSTGLLLRLLDDADTAAALEKDRDDADELHLEACEEWTRHERRARELETTVLQVIGAGMATYKKEVGLIRCQHTNNPCGTDTWAIGQPCECEHCTAYLTLHRLVFPEDKRY